MNALELAPRLEAHRSQLLKQARNLSRTSNLDPEDIVQLTFEKALRLAHTYREEGTLGAWLSVVLKSAYLSAYRKEYRAIVIPTSELSTDEDAPSFEDTIADLKDLYDEIEADSIYFKVSEPFRSALWLCVGKDYTYEEASQILGVPAGTIMSRVSRGKKQLKAILA